MSKEANQAPSSPAAATSPFFLASIEAIVFRNYLPDSISLTLTSWNLKYSYGPLSGLLESYVAPLVPHSISPDHVTYMSLGTLIPCLFLLWLGSAWSLYVCAAIVFLHDMLDRLDGCVARYRHKKDIPRGGGSPKFGAYLDAQFDKVFHVVFLVALLFHGNSIGQLSYIWGFFAVFMMAVQLLSAVVRYNDYYWPPEHAISLKSAGEGKLATTCCNAAAMTACMTLAGFPAQWLTVLLLVVGTDLALRSVFKKLRARNLSLKRNNLLERATWLYDTIHAYLLINVFSKVALQVPARVRLPLLGANAITTMVLHATCALIALPLALFIRSGYFRTAQFCVVLFHVLRTCTHVLEKQQTDQKLATNITVNKSHFFSACSAQIFYAFCLMSLLMSAFPGLSITLLLIVAQFYSACWLAIRVDDAYPKHPAVGSSYARVGGFGTRFGVSMRGKLREKLQVIAVFFTIGSLPSGMLSSWGGVLGVASIVVVIFLSHSALAHKIAFRRRITKLGKKQVATLAPQDASMQTFDENGEFDIVVTIGCFDLFHDGHKKLLKRMRGMGGKLVVGVHDDESIFLLKGRFPVDNTVKRMLNVKTLADQVFCVPSVDPSPYLDAAVDRGCVKERMAFVRGADMPNFPGRTIAEQLMQVRLTPYTEGVSSTLLRKRLMARSEQVQQKKATKTASDGEFWVRFNHEWVKDSDLPPGCSFLRYGDEFFVYRTSEDSPTIS